MTLPSPSELLKRAEAFQGWSVDLRRRLHKIPETKFQEERTSSLLWEELKTMGIPSRRIAGTGLLSEFGPTRSAPVVALRADMDGLSLKEPAGPFASQHPGKMHACGHDVHMAVLLGAARLLLGLGEDLPFRIRLLFQPGEEGGGGAKRMVEEGALEGVCRIFGLHVWMELDSGTASLRSGAAFASSDGFEAELLGRGGHGAEPFKAQDPTVPAGELLGAFQTLISRERDPFEPAILSVPTFQGGESYNVIPERVLLRGTLRTFNPTLRDRLLARMEELTSHYASAWRCQGLFRLFRPPYPVLVNPPELADQARGELSPLLDPQEAAPTLLAEDFAVYLEHCPGLFFLLGNRNPAQAILAPLHNPAFRVDESILPRGSALLAAASLLTLPQP